MKYYALQPLKRNEYGMVKMDNKSRKDEKSATQVFSYVYYFSLFNVMSICLYATRQKGMVNRNQAGWSMHIQNVLLYRHRAVQLYTKYCDDG